MPAYLGGALLPLGDTVARPCLVPACEFVNNSSFKSPHQNYKPHNATHAHSVFGGREMLLHEI